MPSSPIQHPASGTFLPGPAYLRLPRDPQTWIVQGVVPVGGLVNFYGKPKARKSRAAMGLAVAVATGQPDWMGFPIRKTGPVAYLQVDTPRGLWSERIATLTDHGVDMSHLHFADMLSSPFPYNILEPGHSGWLKRALWEPRPISDGITLPPVNPVLVVVDTLREVFRGDENSSEIQQAVISTLQAAVMPAALLLVSHSRKDTSFHQAGGEDLMGDQRGSGYLAGKMDTVVRVSEAMMSFQGRAMGRKDVAIEPDYELGLVKRKGSDSATEESERPAAACIEAARWLAEGGVKKRHLERLMELTGISLATARLDFEEALERGCGRAPTSEFATAA